METTKERPMLFNSEMVRAILDGSKTQTRRIMKPQPTVSESGWFSWNGHAPNSPYGAYASSQINKDSINIFVGSCCPFGKVGDRLWVRETFTADEFMGCRYKADGQQYIKLNGQDTKTEIHCLKWTPSIHMPRWASRINLEITNIRVERLQDISVDDCKDEGIYSEISSGTYMENGEIKRSHFELFKSLWQSINGVESWESNPWVWVINFERLT